MKQFAQIMTLRFSWNILILAVKEIVNQYLDRLSHRLIVMMMKRRDCTVVNLNVTFLLLTDISNLVFL